MMVDLFFLREHVEDAAQNKESFVPVSKLGRFKGETGNRQQYMPVVAKTQSGINNLKWARQIVNIREDEGRTNGWLFQDDDLKRIKGSYYEDDFYLMLVPHRELLH